MQDIQDRALRSSLRYRLLPLLLAGLAGCAHGRAQSNEPVDVLTARRIELVDKHGVARIKMFVEEPDDPEVPAGAWLYICDQNGTAQLMLYSGVSYPTGESLPMNFSPPGPMILMETADEGTGLSIWLFNDTLKSRCVRVYGENKSMELSSEVGKPVALRSNPYPSE